ncbi:hypothetical protein OH685_06745 [Acinetobacter pittii]|nr:hypothetical protein OH685_06745 [Acinetobacter pittii]
MNKHLLFTNSLKKSIITQKNTLYLFWIFFTLWSLSNLLKDTIHLE